MANPLWDIGGANAGLTPIVRICELDVVATSAGKVNTLPTDLTPCKTGAYDVTTTLAAGNVSRGILDDTDIDNAVTRFLTHYSSFVEPYYHLGWKVPAAPIGTSTPPKFYRITVKVGTSKTLGILDVESVNNFTQLLNVKTNEFVPLTGSLRLPINFRIERYALCETPGAPTCASVSGDIAVAPLTVSTGVPDASGISTTVGVTIPKQTSPASTPVTVTISSCPNLNPAVIDLRTFGTCSRVTTDPVLPRLSIPATVFICAVGVNASLFDGLSDAQEERVTLHRYDATGDHAGVVALPHAHACTPGLPGGVVAARPSFGGMLAKLGRGEFKRAATEAVALIAPKPLYAAMFIDLGGGGLTDFFSDFQFALPAKMEIVESTNNQSVAPGTEISPTVRVTDLGGDPVAGAVVHFFTADPSETNGTPVTTGANGLASAPWIIAAGTQHASASGRGIASPNNNGPRKGDSEGDAVFDPFQPIQAHFDNGFTGTPVETPLGLGAVTFAATGISGEIVVFNDVNPFLDGALAEADNAGGNRQLVRNLANVTTGPRATATGIVLSVGHGSAFSGCFGATALAEMRGGNPEIPSLTGAIGVLAANIKVLILCLPTTAYAADEIANMRQFAAEGGRIVFVGEFGRRSETQAAFNQAVLDRENEFLAAMETGTRNIGQGVDCIHAVIPATSIRAHALTAGVSAITVACSSVITLGPSDEALFFDTSNTKVLAGVAKIGAAPPVFLARAAAAAPSAPEPWTPTHDLAGNPISP